MNDLSTMKLFIALGTFLISFISSVSPLKVIDTDDNLFSAGNMLASGVLLAAGLVHQLPDSMKALEDVSDFPLATFIAGCTFCFFLTIEEYLHTQFESPFEQHHEHDTDKDLVRKDNTTPNNKNQNLVHDHHNQNHHSERTKLFVHKEDHNEEEDDDESENSFLNMKGDSSISSRNIGSRQGSMFLSSRSGEDDSAALSRKNQGSVLISTRSGDDAGIELYFGQQKSSRRQISVLESMRDETINYEHPVHYHVEHLAEHARGSLLSSILLLLALSLHSIFEGLAIGVASNTTQLTSITTAVLAHKAFAGYALGSAMVASAMKNLHFLILCFVFSFCGIIGVFLGMILEDNVDPDNNVPIGIISSMVTGTFLYVSIVEIAMKELMTHREDSSNTWDLLKLVAFFVGYLMMSFLAIWV